MKMEPRPQEKATGIIMLKSILPSNRLLVIWRIIWAYMFDSQIAMDSKVRLRIHAAEMSCKDMNIVIYIYIFSCKVETNPSWFVSNVDLT